MELLEQLGLLSCIPNLIESNPDKAEIIHPYAIKKENSNPLEYNLYTNAFYAAVKLLHKENYKFDQKDTINSENPPYLIPILSH